MKRYILRPEMKKFEIYTGRNIEQMPRLIADSRTPMNVSQIMQRRLDVRNFDKLRRFYMYNSFDTGDAVVYHPDGRVKIVSDSQHLREMSLKSERNYGALILTEENYDSLEGEEFKIGKIGKLDKWLKKREVKNHPVWRVLAGDQALLNDYTDYIFAEGKKRSGYKRGMGVYPVSSPNPRGMPKMRAWCIGSLDLGSPINGRGYLDCEGGRLVGMAPKLVSKEDLLEIEKKIYELEDNKKIINEAKSLEKIVYQ